MTAAGANASALSVLRYLDVFTVACCFALPQPAAGAGFEGAGGVPGADAGFSGPAFEVAAAASFAALGLTNLMSGSASALPTAVGPPSLAS